MISNELKVIIEESKYQVVGVTEDGSTISLYVSKFTDAQREIASIIDGKNIEILKVVQ